jgi:hypothetical protein
LTIGRHTPFAIAIGVIGDYIDKRPRALDVLVLVDETDDDDDAVAVLLDGVIVDDVDEEDGIAGGNAGFLRNAAKL